MSPAQRFKKIKAAFAQDGFAVKDFSRDEKYRSWARQGGYLVVEEQGIERLGMLAEHETAVNHGTGEPKRVYYIEGKGFALGMLMGLMAEHEVYLMSNVYIDNAIFELINIPNLAKSSSVVKHLIDVLMEILGDSCQKVIGPDVPRQYHREIEGLLKGCQTINPETEVTEDDLWMLNFGIDMLFAHLFTGKIFRKKGVLPAMLKVPLMCNAFSIQGREIVENDAHFFGRDFMFPTGDVFHKAACLMICQPYDENGDKAIPFVSQTAPGFVGAIAAMNLNGLAIGVDVNMNSLCNPDRPGLNSLALNRHVIQSSSTIEDAVRQITDTPRGVSWFYPLADGQSGRACVVEAGANIGTDPFPYLDGISIHYRSALPNEIYIQKAREKYGTPAPEKGLMVRWDDYRYPADYLDDFNENLWKKFNWDILPRLFRFLLDILGTLWYVIRHLVLIKLFYTLYKVFKGLSDLFKKTPYNKDYFGERRYINVLHRVDANCPSTFYFAPQRENKYRVTLVSNHCITPEMRLRAMEKWICRIADGRQNDFQWRYDELNNQILQAIDEAKRGRKIDEARAMDLINFLRPDRDNPSTDCREYYNPHFAKDPDSIPIHGSVSLFELTKKTVASHFGYHGDEWIRISLPRYF